MINKTIYNHLQPFTTIYKTINNHLQPFTIGLKNNYNSIVIEFLGFGERSMSLSRQHYNRSKIKFSQIMMMLKVLKHNPFSLTKQGAEGPKAQ